jgi:hypothetical protein
VFEQSWTFLGIAQHSEGDALDALSHFGGHEAATIGKSGPTPNGHLKQGNASLRTNIEVLTEGVVFHDIEHGRVAGDAAKVSGGHHFLTSVVGEPKLFIVGDEDELRRMGEVRVAQGAQEFAQRNRGSGRNRRS